MDRTHSFGYWLKRRRKALDLTQAELAQRASCSLDLIHKIEADVRRPSRQLAEKLADSLGLNAADRVAFVQAARAERAVDQLDVATQPLEQPQRRSSTNLPAQLTPLIGRQKEVTTITSLLRRVDMRLVTLSGPGGIGKTRLSLQVAAELMGDFVHGVWFIDIAPIREPNLVTSQIATTLGVKEVGAQPLLATLKAYLRDTQMLLLLDNFEQVIDAAPVVSELLGSAPQLKVLVTSREVLKLRGEKEIAVPPLVLPDLAQLPPLEQLSQYAAVALFIQRALDTKPDFEVTNANAPAVAEICARLDGLPLAIELAAARVKLFAPDALLSRLSSRLTLLTGGSRDLPARQQTIRSTITWSYDLLTEAEQTLFRRLSVFVGGWTVEAAEMVCGEAAMEGLATLMDKSLIRSVSAGEEPHFMMLETIREYALERLEANGEAEAMRRQHAAYYLKLCQIEWPDRATWLHRFDPEYDNLWSALAWSQTTAGEPEVALGIAGGLIQFWYNRSLPREAIDALERTLNHPHGVGRTAAHAAARANLGLYHGLTGNYVAARKQFEQALSLAHEVGDTERYAKVLHRLGWLAREQGDSATAWARMMESLVLFQKLGNTQGAAWTLVLMAEVAILEEEPGRAETLLAESCALGHQLADTKGWMLHHLGCGETTKLGLVHL